MITTIRKLLSSPDWQQAEDTIGIIDPQDMTGTLTLVGNILKWLAPRPVTVTAAAPDQVRVRWDSHRLADRNQPKVPDDRNDQMRYLKGLVRSTLDRTGVVHHCDPVLLVADDGVVIALFGDGRTGIVIREAAR
jgi:hypothetical protein